MFGLTWIGLSLNFKFGHLPFFEPLGRFFATFSIVSGIWSVRDCNLQIHQYVSNTKIRKTIDYGFDHRPKIKPSAVGLKYETPSFWHCFITAFYGHQDSNDLSNVAMVTSTPSNLSVIVSSVTITIFGMIGWLQVHYLVWGHQGMIYLQSTFPKTTQMTVYGYLGAALANNLTAFFGTLVESLFLSAFTSINMLFVCLYSWISGREKDYHWLWGVRAHCVMCSRASAGSSSICGASSPRGKIGRFLMEHAELQNGDVKLRTLPVLFLDR